MNLAKSIIYSFVFGLIALSFGALPVLAQNASLINPGSDKQLSITSLGVTGAQNTIRGVVVLENKTDVEYKDLIYSVKVLAPSRTTNLTIEGKPATLISEGLPIEYVNSEKFYLKAGERKDVTIAIPYQSTISSGNYQVVFTLLDSFGKNLATSSKSLNLTGSRNYFNINPTTCQVRVNGTVYTATDGPLVNPNSAVEASCEVTNDSSSAREVSFGYEYAVRFVIGYPLSKVQTFQGSQTFSFGAKETKRINFTLPALKEPQVYEAMVYLTSSAGTKLSPMVSFRWIVKGASATITGISIDKDNYGVGTSAQVIVKANPSIDLFWRGTPDPSFPGLSPDQGTNLVDPKLQVVVLDKNNNECGKTIQDLPKIGEKLSWDDQTVNVSITNSCEGARAKVTILDSGQVLAEVEKAYDPASVKTLNSNPDGTPKKTSYWLLAIGLIAGLLILGGVVWYLRKRRGGGSMPPAIPMTAVIFLGLFGAYTIGLNFNLAKLVPAKFEVRAQTATPSATIAATPTATASATISPTATPIDTTPVVSTTPPPFANYPVDIIRNPINNPPEAENVTATRPWSGSNFITYMANFHDFVQKDPTGLSQFRINGECDSFSIDFSGYTANSNYCSNLASGVGVEAFIDGIRTPILNPTSVNNNMFFGNMFIMYGARDGFKKGSFNLNAPSRLPGGQHRVELIVHGVGVHVNPQGFSDATITDSTDIRYKNCGQDGKSCVGKMDYVFSCPIKCPNPGDTIPHGECDGFQCKQVNTCGTTKCGKNSDCGGCDNPNETRPHMACDGVQCKAVDSCGTPTCTDSEHCCPAGETNPHQVCNGSSCTMVNKCGKDKCVDGQTNPHGVCDGVSCKQSYVCGGSECTGDGDCFSDNMCKCDGFDAQIVYPGKEFSFDAFAKVEGKDITKAEVKDMTFFMTEGNTVIAKSGVIIPQIVEDSGTKVRYKASWKTPPPSQIKTKTDYRVWAQLNCKPKKKAGSANIVPPSTSSRSGVLGIQTIANRGLLGQAIDYLMHLFGKDSNVLGVVALTQQETNKDSLQLRTLNYARITETDNCRFAKFSFDEGIN